VATAQSDVYRQLKHSITNFELRPGAPLVEGELSERYGVSRTPVREALRQLELEGFVLASAGRGRFVRDISLRDYEDVSQVRLALEDLAVVQACERAEDGAIAELRTSWDGADPASPDGSYVYADERFHSGVASLSSNDFLVDELARVNDRIRIIRLTDFTDEARIATVREEHDAILSAVGDRDAERARELMRSHIVRSQGNVRELIARALERAYLDSPKGGR
jgi:DNA-binding GntR family transcriptional regulator